MTQLNENFTGGTSLGWTRVIGAADPNYTDDLAWLDADNGTTFMRCNTALSSVDQDISVAFSAVPVPFDGTVINWGGPFARMPNAAEWTGYTFNIDLYLHATAYLQRIIDGTGETYWYSDDGPPQTGWENYDPNSAHTLRLTVATEGGNVRLIAYIDGVQIMSVLDSDANRLLTGSYVGYGGQGDGAAVFFDTWAATELSGAPSTNAPAGLSSHTRAALDPTVETTGGSNVQAPAGHASASASAHEPDPQGEVTFNHPNQVRAALQPTVNAVSAPGASPAGHATQTRTAYQPTISTGATPPDVAEGTHTTGGALEVVSSG